MGDTNIRQRMEVAAGPEERFTEGRFVIIEAGKHSVGITRLRGGALTAVRNWWPAQRGANLPWHDQWHLAAL